jgi:hypothetical protein
MKKNVRVLPSAGIRLIVFPIVQLLVKLEGPLQMVALQMVGRKMVGRTMVGRKMLTFSQRFEC